DSLTRTLAGMRACAASGLGVEIEIPLLPARLQNLAQLLELAHRAVPTLRAAWFTLPRYQVPAAIAPPRWSEGAPLLAQGLARARELGVKVAIHRRNGIPFCATQAHPEWQSAFQFS